MRINMSKYKCVLFDLDGTIIDSSSGVKKSIVETIELLKLPAMREEELDSCIGPPIQKSFQKIYNMQKSEADEAAAVFRKIYREKNLFDAVIYDDMMKLIDFLKNQNIKIMIATYKREDYTIELLEKFDLYNKFDFVKGADFEGKLTKSDIMNICIEQSGCNKEEVVMIGDTIHDLGAAQELGVDFIAVTYGFGFKDIAENIDAVFVASNVKDICDYMI